MTFVALLTKELRLRMRRERTIWLMIIYILLLGLTGWLALNTLKNTNEASNINFTGQFLYDQIALLQLLLIIFITPALTATTINGEKTRQTFDLLLCSQISGLCIAAGKLAAGLTNILLLIAASIPLFSLIFLFGGIEPGRLIIMLLVFIVTALQVGTFGLFCSIFFRHPAVSTVVAYVVSLFWLALPYTILLFWSLFPDRDLSSQQTDLLFLWNPMLSLFGHASTIRGSLTSIAPWITYTIVSLLVTGIFFSLSAHYVRPNLLRR